MTAPPGTTTPGTTTSGTASSTTPRSSFPTASASSGRPSHRARVVRQRESHAWLRRLAAVVAGLVLSVAFPPHDLWYLAPLAVAALALLVRGCSLRGGYLLGLLFGLGFLVPLLAWSRIAGDDGWLVLSLLQALFVALVGPMCVVAWRLPLSGLWIGTSWVVMEALRGRAPFGGFPWGRLAFVQPAEGGIAPVTRLAALGGAPLVTFAIALAGGLLATAAVALARRRPRQRATAGVVAGAVALLGGIAVLAAGALVPTPTAAQPDPAGAGPETATVAAIQGNVPRMGLDWMGQRRAVTRNHLLRTQELAAAVAAGRTPAPDVVLWPENSSDLDPFADPEAAALLSEASQSIGRPVLVGAVLQGPGAGHVRNAGLLWGPDGYLGQMYVKRHPVPFGEYLPGRPVLQKLVKRFADSLPNDFLPGRSPGLFATPGPGGTYRVGDVICFEVAYDGLVRDVVDGGSRLLVVQTNNATFGRSGETYQQLAMSRLRSIEHGRSSVVVATSGRSALIRPDGTVVAASPLYTPDVLVAQLPMRSSRTIADRLGGSVEYALVGLGLLVPTGLLVLRRRRPTRTGGRHGVAATSPQAGGEAGSSA